MIRRDYLLGMIDRCVAALRRAQTLISEGQAALAQGELDQAAFSLCRMHVSDVLAKSEGELVAALLQGEPTQVLGHKCLLLSGVMSQASELAAARGLASESATCRLKALNLQLTVPPHERPNGLPEAVPSLVELVNQAGLHSVPMPTKAALMQYFEQSREYARAEDALFAMLEASANDPATIRFGRQFYDRLLAQPDDVLLAGNLPREEVEESLDELRSRAKSVEGEQRSD